MAVIRYFREVDRSIDREIECGENCVWKIEERGLIDEKGEFQRFEMLESQN